MVAEPPIDAPDKEWRRWVADQLLHLHQCIEKRDEERKAEIDKYHRENREDAKQALAAMQEVKNMAQAAIKWVSTEEKAREDQSLVEAGRQLERERWLKWFHRIETAGDKMLDWGVKGALGGVLVLIGKYLGWL